MKSHLTCGQYSSYNSHNASGWRRSREEEDLGCDPKDLYLSMNLTMLQQTAENRPSTTDPTFKDVKRWEIFFFI